MDFLVCILAFIYDFNFRESLGIIAEQDYISKIIERINAKDPSTHKQMAELGVYANEYIENKIKSP